MSVNVIGVEKLTFCYNGIEVLQDISFAVEKGSYLGVAGPNGSGKTTLMKIISRIVAIKTLSLSPIIVFPLSNVIEKIFMQT